MTLLIFHHIPKTAGTSFLEVLRRNHAEEERFFWYQETPTPWRFWRDWLDGDRAGIRCVASHTAQHLIPFLRERALPFQVLTFLRDPVERCISLYHYLLELAQKGEALQGGRIGRLLLDKGWSLDDVYQNPSMELAGFFNGQARAILRPFRVRLPLSADAEPPVELEDALRECDLGIVEDFDSTIERWAARFGWRDLTHERKNITLSRRSAPPLSEQTVDLIRAHNRIDAELHRNSRHFTR